MEGRDNIALLHTFSAEDGSNRVVDHIEPKGGGDEVPSFDKDGQLWEGGIQKIQDFLSGH